MWWFTRKSARPLTPPDGTQSAEREFQALVPDIAAIVDGEPVAIKIWLPTSVAQTVKWTAEREGESQSEWLRKRLVGYAYGQVAIEALKLRARDEGDGGLRFSRGAVDRSKGRWVYKVPQLGKNTVAFKLWASQVMRDDLQALADHAKVGLSAFTREVIVADLLGHASLPERPEITASAGAAASAWERGDDVPIAELAADEFNGLGEYETVWREGDDPPAR